LDAPLSLDRRSRAQDQAEAVWRDTAPKWSWRDARSKRREALSVRVDFQRGDGGKKIVPANSQDPGCQRVIRVRTVGNMRATLFTLDADVNVVNYLPKV
jgi:hypothetical protein